MPNLASQPGDLQFRTQKIASGIPLGLRLVSPFQRNCDAQFEPPCAPSIAYLSLGVGIQ